jgi:UDP:flavonoid glycosyltransferase YjiC (YdhE family)
LCRKGKTDVRFLFTTFEGGGHVPPAILMASALARRGHDILFVSDEANRTAVRAEGLKFAPWRSAPSRQRTAQADDPLQDWRRRWPPAVVRAVCDAVATGPASAYAHDTQAFIQEFAPDLVVTNELLLGCMVACEATDTPCALLTGNLWPYPTRLDQPPFGPGWAPPQGRAAKRAHESARAMIERWFDAGLAPLNTARAQFGLPPLAKVLDQTLTARVVVLGASRAFDYGSASPSPFVYAGPLIDLPAPAAAPDLTTPPQVLVSFSTTYQNQAGVMARCLRALAPLAVRVVATTGPAVDPASLPATPNARVVTWGDHDELVPASALLVCHGGHGTLVRALRHGVPVLCLPMGRDHPENGRRLTHHGAGLMVSRNAGVRVLRHKIRRLLEDDQFAAAAGRLGDRIMRDQPVERQGALLALERAAGSSAAQADAA